MSRLAARLVLPRSVRAGGGRFRLAPPRDDLRHCPAALLERGGWQPGLGDLDGEGAASSEGSGAPGEEEAEEEPLPPIWAEAVPGGPGCHEEVYGTISKGKFRARYLDGAGTRSADPASQRAFAPASVAELVASGQPKEEIYRAIREAYGVGGEE
mmetsp:Transcript_37962/g.80720  ORF Transcript_37962/g.80720 Transcript_37962/m.80720 type:complete len:155 (-) Transcript_37962:36-500(-)